MLWIALILFTISAVVGVVVVLRRWQESDVSLGLILGHGIPAVLGLVLAYPPVSRSPATALPEVGLVLLAVAAVAGLALLVWQLRTGRFFMPAALLHGLVALGGLLLLLLWAVTRPRF